MTRSEIVLGEKPWFWVGSSRNDLLEFPDAVKNNVGVAMSVAQFGGKHPGAQPWQGEGPGICEIVDDHKGDRYRAVYTVKCQPAIYGFHAFQKKSPRGRRTAPRDVEFISRRLRAANQDYEVRYGKPSK